MLQTGFHSRHHHLTFYQDVYRRAQQKNQLKAQNILKGETTASKNWKSKGLGEQHPLYMRNNNHVIELWNCASPSEDPVWLSSSITDVNVQACLHPYLGGFIKAKASLREFVYICHMYPNCCFNTQNQLSKSQCSFCLETHQLNNQPYFLYSAA